jgi:hypothetical protein
VRPDGQRRELRDLLGPRERALDVRDALHETEAVGVLTRQLVGRQEQCPRRPDTDHPVETLDRGVVDGEPEARGGDPEAGAGRRRAHVAEDRQLGTGAERGTLDRRHRQ